MGKHKMPSSSSTAQQKILKTKAKNRVDDLQGIFCDLQQARKESRSADTALLEEQVNQMLREWKTELNDPSPATSLLAGSPSSSVLSSDMERLLQLNEEGDDASSVLAACGLKMQSEQPTLQYVSSGVQAEEQEIMEKLMLFDTGLGVAESPLLSCDECLGLHVQINLKDPLFPNAPPSNIFHDGTCEIVSSSPLPVSPHPSAFLGPKCALWDCPRPSQQGEEWYCSHLHAGMAFSEGALGMAPVLRPGGIDLKDGPLVAALVAKSLGKMVGIPDCGGAATSKSPWNAPELFDTWVLSGEAIREWLFFDKPKRAFESGTRKQRSLPDYHGRGWHESRKQTIQDTPWGGTGLKRSYYMDPQPNLQSEWHLYEYQIAGFDASALYRLELKPIIVPSNRKTGSKSRAQNENIVTSLQRRIGMLPGDLTESKSSPNASGRQCFNVFTDFAVEDVDSYFASP